jgi:hypothetical protein
MKDIKKILMAFAILLAFLGCTKDVDLAINENNFVRFSLLLDKNSEILEYPKVVPNISETSNYTHVSTKIIKIPVVLTGNLKTVPIDVFYEVQTEGNFTDFTVSPANKVIIPAGKLIDTLRITINSRWLGVATNKIKLKITRTSDPTLNIGWNNSTNKMDQIIINLGDLNKTRYYFEQNLYNLSGVVNEEVLIPVLFSQPVTNAMIGNFNFIQAQFVALSICDGASANFNYSLTRMPFVDGASKLFYKFKLVSTTQFASNLRLTLNTGLTDFVPFGTTITDLKKDELIVRQGNPAAIWYNLADSFYRTFGKAWYFSTADGFCRWSNFFAFTKPVPVPAGSPFDNGQGYHKYKIGFVGNNLPIGTNPFDFSRFYDGTSVSSPAFTIREALEFFPANGNSLTNGIVKVIPQTLTFVRSSNNTNVALPICGSGNYSFNSVLNRWEMYLEIHCNETAINGNPNVVRAMYIYSNNNNNANPANLTIPCSNRLNL